MTGSDAILVGEGFVSEHYLTTDATAQSFKARVLERRKAWDAETAQRLPTPRSRFTEARLDLEVGLAALAELGAETGPDAVTLAGLGRQDPAEAAQVVYDRLIEVLGLRGHGLHLDRTGPLLRVSCPGITNQAPLAVVLARPVDAVEDVLAKDGDTLFEPVRLDDDAAEVTSAARLVSALFVSDGAPDLVLVLAGRWAVLTERERWAEGRYLAVDVQLVCQRGDTRKGGEIDRALTCLSAESIAPDADGALWWRGVLEESVKHTVGVSKDLREGVRLSIEIIANDVVSRRAACGLEPLPAAQAHELAKQSLRFLYRILFLLYAEASPELGVLPVGAPEYDEGYSLDRLRDLVQVELATPQGRTGSHVYDSLGTLFRLVRQGHDPAPGSPTNTAGVDGLTFNALDADLFRPEATAHIDQVGIGNAALQRVLTHLLLSKEKRGRDRGFISYAELGINQLGAVYEGLMSYTGFFAETDLYEVAKGGDPSKGSWMVPVERAVDVAGAEGIAPADLVRAPDEATGEPRPVLHPAGSFVFRLAGRDRQQSASYYTPEVLTRFTVGQALEELLDQDGRTTRAAEVLGLTVCEPALGSGAFAIEAVRQLAGEYLRRRQDELGKKIDPDEYPRRLQEVKSYLALHNVYGVDLNATAVELAEISLWLDTMVEGLPAPWFGLHLRRGNSLIGARRAVYRRDQVLDKTWLKAVPRDVPLASLADDAEAGRVAGDADGTAGGIHHFLLPAEGWGSAADAKEADLLAGDATKALKAWRGRLKARPSKAQVAELSELAERVEVLWQIAFRRLRIAESEVRRSIPVWESDDLPAGGAVQRGQIEQALAHANGAYRRLRRVMDAWTALWFWPLTMEAATVLTPDGPVRAEPPTLQQWIDGVQALLGRTGGALPKGTSSEHQTLQSAVGWDELGVAEELELAMAGAVPVDKVLREHPWLVVCDRVAAQQGFFHWNLEFAPVFARGGFDLQVGNPPWVRPTTDVDALLAEGDPWWGLALKPSEAQRAARREETLALSGIRDLMVTGTADVAATAAFVGSVPQYPHLEGLQPDLYRCFMERMWSHGSPRGTIGMIHLESHFTDEKAGLLRSELYLRLRRHWHFQNQLKLFEIQNEKQYGVTVHGSRQQEPAFIQASWLYHPDTAVRSRKHDGSGPEPGLKDIDDHWDHRPHQGRITEVDDETLATWHEALESPAVPLRRTRMLFSVNRSTAVALQKVARSGRIAELDLRFSPGWHEKNDRKKGVFETNWGAPRSWRDVILHGTHLFVATPLYKTPNKTLKSQRDWSATDFETLGTDAVPVTAYKPAGNPARYDASYTDWGDADVGPQPARDYYRVAWRTMAANTGERTLSPALIPPGSAHVDGVFSAGSPGMSPWTLASAAAQMGSLISDFVIRVVPKSTIRSGTANRLPLVADHVLEGMLVLRSLRLNCVTDAYADLWSACYSDDLTYDAWTGGFDHARRLPLGQVATEWTAGTVLRIAADRRQALVEVDSLVALMLGMTADELCTIYRTQFPVLYGYDRGVGTKKYFYDAQGRLVPHEVLKSWRAKGARASEEDRTATNQAGNTYTYEPPFLTLDREADMRQAYAEFEQRLRDRT